MKARIRAAARTHTGLAARVNEDVAVVDLTAGLALVADGMGGARGGDVAARIVAEVVSEQLRQSRDMPPDVAVLRAIQLADEGIRSRAAAVAERLQGMAATVVVAMLHRVLPGRMIVGNVGDTRAYLFSRRQGDIPAPVTPVWTPVVATPEARLVCISRDHTAIAELVERGHLTREAGLAHPLRTRLNHVVGREPWIEPSIAVVRLEAGDYLLLCSDGLWEMVPDERIAALLEAAPSASAAADALLKAALEAGGRDNVTVVVLAWERMGAGAATERSA